MGEDSVQLLLRLLQAALGETFTYFDGDPDLIANHDLPAISVELVSDRTTGGTFAEDDITDTLLVKVIYNKQDDWTNQDDKLNMTHKKVRDTVGRRNDAGNYEANTVKGALRPEVYGTKRIGGDLSVDYGFLSRPENVFTSEGHVTVEVKYSVTVEPLQN